MNTLITILLVVAGIIALLLIAALFMKKEHYVNREIIINAPRQKVFDFLKLLKNQDQFNKWATADKKTGKKNSKVRTEQLDLFIPGAEIKVPVREKRKLRTLLKEKELKQKFVL